MVSAITWSGGKRLGIRKRFRCKKKKLTLYCFYSTLSESTDGDGAWHNLGVGDGFGADRYGLAMSVRESYLLLINKKELLFVVGE